MQQYVWPIVFALFVWWFTTGVIIYLDGLPRKTFPYSFAGTTVLLAVALWGLYATRNDTTVVGAYLAFTWGTLAWGWQEMSFYMGYVTGPRRTPCPEGCSGLKHFGHAVQTSLYHELAIIVFSLLVVALTWGGANQVGMWTFMIMWWMHQSAKLNVFFGVRNLNEEFLPEHLQFLRSFLTKKPMNVFFPVSITVSTVITALLFQWAFAATDTFSAVGYTLLGALMVLAVLEHWLLVLPMPNKIWNWGLKSRQQVRPADISVVAGFLGAGKTTFLRRVLATADPNVRTVVLVNDFGEMGVDSSLLSGRGANVVELPNGCICCSLRNDLARQVREVVTRWAPQRVLVEPSGVAEVASLLRVLSQPSLQDVVGSVQVCTLVDAGNFLNDYGRMPEYFEAQANFAPTLLISKADLVSQPEIRTVEQTLHALNPVAQVFTASYGVVDGGHDPFAVAAVLPEEHESHSHDEDALGMQNWSAPLPGSYDDGALREMLQTAANGGFGEVVRVKGIAQVNRGWVHFDMAGGRVSVAAFAARDGEQPRIMVIGRQLDVSALKAALADTTLTERPAIVARPSFEF